MPLWVGATPDPHRQHHPRPVQRVVRRAVQGGRMHDDEVARSAGHLLQPDGMTPDLRLDPHQCPDVRAPRHQQGREVGVFCLEPIAHALRAHRPAVCALDLQSQLVRPRDVERAAAVRRRRLQEGERPQDGEGAERLAADVQVLRGTPQRRRGSREGDQRPTPGRAGGVVPRARAEQGVR